MTLKEEIYNNIFNDITAGKYQDGDILTESRLVEKYQVSKSPVREALIELCKDRVLHSLPRMGYQVVPVTLKEVLDILEYRLDIEICGLKRAFPKFTKEDLLHLQDMIIKPSELISGDISWQRNLRFHLKIYECSGNKYGYQELEHTIKQSTRYVSQYFYSAWKRSSASNGENHKILVDYLMAGDIELACITLEKDIMFVKEEIQDLHAHVFG